MRSILQHQENEKEKFTSLFWRILISYVSVLLLPLLICSFYYIHSYNAVKDRAFSNHHLILTNTGASVDAILRDTLNLGSHLQLNQYVNSLSYQKSTPGSSQAMDMYYLKKDLGDLLVSNSAISQLSIYFPASSYIVSASSVHRRDLLPYMEEKSGSLSSGNWTDICNGLQNDHYFCFSDPSKSFFAVAQPLLTDSDDQPLSILCVSLNKKSLLSLFDNRLLMEYPCAFALIDQEAPLLSAGEPEAETWKLSCPEIFANCQSNPPTAFYEPPSSPGLIVDCFPTLFPRLSLISIAGKQSFLAPLTELLVVLLSTILTCILAGLFIVTYFSRKNYEPISRILRFLREDPDEPAPVRNEYSYIMSRLVQNRNEIEKQRTLLKNNYLQKIFTGEIAVTQIPEPVAQQFCLDLSPTPVCVVLLSVEEENGSETLSDLTFFIIQNIFGELLSHHFSASSFSFRQRRISVLINVPEALEDPGRLIVEALEQLMKLSSVSFLTSIRAGISSVCEWEHISDAWMQADTALQYQRLFEADRCCRYDTIPQKQTIGTIPLNNSEYVINIITNGSQQQIIEYFDSIAKELSKHSLSLADAKSCYYFFYHATAMLQLYCQNHYGAPLDSLELLSERFFEQSLPKTLSQLCSVYQNAWKELADRKETASQTKWGTDIKRFIRNNYFDANINLNTVAGHFRISPSYLSKKFKEQYQKSVIDYLYEIRIDNSLKLLTETDLKITDIAQMTGFVDSNAFIRIFKKFKGTTPGRYKESMLRAEER